ncbi:HNH endonuclease [Candidatus Aerophobetes bacterium]|nr:HNH endonuclease [Candidatus Aerophobetes bacterium]
MKHGPQRDKRKYKDRRDYLIKAVRKRRKKIREMAVEYKGGKCEICGYDRCIEALEFHHLDRKNKDFGISNKGYTRSWKKIKEELDKCMLLCANCHREVHAGLQLPRETVVEKLGEFREAYGQV